VADGHRDATAILLVPPARAAGGRASPLCASPCSLPLVEDLSSILGQDGKGIARSRRLVAPSVPPTDAHRQVPRDR
jgi:hypothetical protein